MIAPACAKDRHEGVLDGFRSGRWSAVAHYKLGVERDILERMSSFILVPMPHIGRALHNRRGDVAARRARRCWCW